jgi:hypothetical protein
LGQSDRAASEPTQGRVCKLSAGVKAKIQNATYIPALLVACFHAGFLLSLFFDPEDGGDMFLRNVG